MLKKRRAKRKVSAQVLVELLQDPRGIPEKPLIYSFDGYGVNFGVPCPQILEPMAGKKYRVTWEEI